VSDDSREGRIGRGDALVARGKALELGRLAPRFAAFEAAHARLVEAEREVAARRDALEAQEAALGLAGAFHDLAIEVVAAALVADGFPRVHPFRPLGFVSPSELAKLGAAAEADEALRLVEALSAHPRASERARAATERLATAARNLKEALRPLRKLARARDEATAKRDALAEPWEAAHAELLVRAQLARDDAGAALFAALFVGPPGGGETPTKGAKKRRVERRPARATKRG
jgi:hypothetical protein